MNPFAMHHRNDIVFMGRQTKTDYYGELVKQFGPIVMRVGWIVVTSSQRDALLQDFATEDVLYLPLCTPETRASYTVKTNDLRLRDRRLMHMQDHCHTCLRAIQAPILDFLDTGRSTLVVGELTYAHEVLTYHLAHARWALQSVPARLRPDT